MSASKGLVICVTNDITYDQRVLKIAHTLYEAYQVKVTIVGRKLAGNNQDQSQKLIFKRLDCFFKSGPAFYLEYNIRLFFFLIVYRKSYNTLCCCDPDTIIGGMTAAQILNKNTVYDAHEWFAEVPELSGKSFKKKIWTQVEKFGVKISQQRYSVGPMLASKLAEIYGSPFEVIRNVPVVSTNNNQDFEKENIIIYQGAINAGRGLETLMEASKSLPHYQILLVGDGDVKAELMVLKNNLHLENVIFIDKQTPDQLKNITKKAKYGYNLLDARSLSYYFSLANKFFDYAALGVVSINSLLQEYEHLIKKYSHALMLKDLDARDFANLINTISEEDRIKMVERGKKMAVENSWELESAKLINLYRPFLS
ncbi:MAG: glycosyltransferase [Saprospiraceae bacterium]|nr:glycosyltransferase [Saprospiraceae bacterium]